MKNKTFIIAEMACSHDGSARLARKIIDGAGSSNADAIQLQIWSAKDMMTPDRKEFKTLELIELSFPKWQSLINYSKSKYPKMKVYVCVYENGTLNKIKSLKKVDGFKINSSDLSNNDLLKEIGKTNKQINLSIGASTSDEIRNAIKVLKKYSKSKIALLYGFQSFPTKSSELNLNLIKLLIKKFNLQLGYQDHSAGETDEGYWLPAFAMGIGATIIEKHITHDRDKKGLDFESALNASEFKEFTSMIHLLDESRGKGIFRNFIKSEIEYRKFQKKTIVARHDICKGEKFSKRDFLFLRAKKLVFQPNEVGKLVNKTVKRNIKKFQVIEKKDFT
tara:strand:+ start:361 stop:1362 length:1002 start_codon:yes stop_codon:yes gene_type:complete